MEAYLLYAKTQAMCHVAKQLVAQRVGFVQLMRFVLLYVLC